MASNPPNANPKSKGRTKPLAGGGSEDDEEDDDELKAEPDPLVRRVGGCQRRGVDAAADRGFSLLSLLACCRNSSGRSSPHAANAAGSDSGHKSDAILSCPACFNIVCYDCQRYFVPSGRVCL